MTLIEPTASGTARDEQTQPRALSIALTRPLRCIEEIASYHAHVYFDPDCESVTAAHVRDALSSRFAVRIGRWRDGPVGPHSRAMFQVAFDKALFATLAPWLMLNHHGLSILIHPNTTSLRRDHIEDALWIGPRLALYADRLPAFQAIPDEAGEPNTLPQSGARNIDG